MVCQVTNAPVTVFCCGLVDLCDNNIIVVIISDVSNNVAVKLGCFYCLQLLSITLSGVIRKAWVT